MTIQTMTSRFGLPEWRPAFQFAGFSWPRFVSMLPRGDMRKRLERAKNPVCGPYSHGPAPIEANDMSRGRSFYLNSDFAPGLRWQWCDDVCTSIRHTGWYADNYQDTKMRGVVFALPHGRGWLAGWSMGVGMASSLEYYVYDSARDAAFAADSLAEYAAEIERERQVEEESEEYGSNDQ